MASKNHFVLIAEDDEDDYLLLRDAMKESAPTLEFGRVKDGEELIDYLMKNPNPSLVFLDLNMPKKDGREALREIKSRPSLTHVPIVILTNSNAQLDVLQAYQLGASTFIRKPSDYSELVTLMQRVTGYWLQAAKLPVV